MPYIPKTLLLVAQGALVAIFQLLYIFRAIEFLQVLRI